MFTRLKSESEAIVKDLIQLVYFMRGAIPYHTMFSMTPFERGLVDAFVTSRLEAESKKPYPQY
jgi:hypothetical protein